MFFNDSSTVSLTFTSTSTTCLLVPYMREDASACHEDVPFKQSKDYVGYSGHFKNFKTSSVQCNLHNLYSV